MGRVEWSGWWGYGRHHPPVAPLDTPGAFARDGITMRDVLDGKVPGYDADEIIAKAMEDTGSYDGPWSPFEGLNP